MARLGENQESHSPLRAVEELPSGGNRRLDTFPNPHPDKNYSVEFETDELTCVCPVTSQPDFASVRIRYSPADWCVELKSLKIYFVSFRDEGHFHEDLTGLMLGDLAWAINPQYIQVELDFNVRGGIHTVVRAQAYAGETPTISTSEIAEEDND